MFVSHRGRTGVREFERNSKRNGLVVPFGLSDKLTNRNARSPSLGLKPLK